MPYQQIKLDLTPAQQKKALKGLAFRLSATQIGKGQVVMVSRSNYKKIQSAKNGVMLDLAPGEVIATASFHKLIPDMSGDMSGSGIFDSIWSGLKSVGNFLKQSGIASTLADSAAAAAVPFLGPMGSTVARKIVKDTTGVGLAGSIVTRALVTRKMSKAKKSTSGSGSGSGLYL